MPLPRACSTFLTITTTFGSNSNANKKSRQLVFSADEEGGASTDSATFAYINNGNIIINGGPSTSSGTSTLQVVDVMGRVIRTIGLSQCGSRITTAGIPTGVYVLRLINGDDVKTQKIVVE